MTKILSGCLVLALVVFSGVASLDAASTVTLSTTASVPLLSPELTVLLLQIDDGNPDNNPFTGSTTATSLTFGTLTHLLSDGSEAGGWFANRFFCAVVFTQPFGLPYEVRHTGTAATSGVNALPNGSFGITPVYSSTDEFSPGVPQGAMPVGATLGTAGSAVIVNKLVYSSEPAPGPATARIIQVYYSLPPDGPGGVDPFPGYQQIPLSQPTGSYSATVTLTITLK